MEIVYTIFSTFLLDMFIKFIINQFHVRNEKKVSLIFITIINGLELLFYLGILVNQIIYYISTKSFSFVEIMSTMLPIAGIVIAYLLVLSIILDGAKIFKSKRLKQFEKASNTSDKKSVLSKALPTVFVSFGAILLIYEIYLLATYDQNNILTIIGVGIISIISLVFGFILAFKPTKAAAKANNLYIIKMDLNTICYISINGSKETDKESLGSLYDDYLFDDYGYLVFPDKKIHCYGIKVSKISDNVLQSITLSKDDINKYSNYIDSFNKYSKKKIYINDDGSVIKETSY